MFFTGAGIALIVGSAYDEWRWFGAALGVFTLGQAIRQVAFTRHLAGIRRRLHISIVRGFKLTCATNVIAGGLVIVGALISLQRVFGLIVAYGAFCWVWGWAWVLAHSREWKEPDDIGSAP